MTKTGYQHAVNRGRTRSTLYLLLFALLLRGLIPIGYMPAPNALLDQHLFITFCLAPGSSSAANFSALSSWLDGDGDSQSNTTTTGSDCLFSLVSHQPLGAPVLPGLRVLLLAIFSRPAPVFENTALPVFSARGPPLGSRAPPFLF